jgi:hypothetical protein
MRHAPRHATGPGSPSTATIVAILAVGIVYLIAAVAVHLAASVDHLRAVSWWPLTAIIQLAKGQRRLPTAAEWIVPAMLVPATLLLVLVGRVWVARRPAVSDVDRAARLMGYGRRLAPLTEKAAARTAARLGVHQPGIPVARSVADGQLLYATWEEMQLCVAGPRRMKTTGVAIPGVLSAPGACLATSNKRDVYTHTRYSREQKGTIWNLDPAGITGAGTADWWWNPLSYLSLGSRPHKRAQELAGAFVDAYRHPAAKPDPFFDPKGEQLVANFLMAAWLDGRYLTDAYRWTTRQRDETPAKILERHGRELPFASVMGEINAAPEQRSGIYGTAEKILQFLQEPEIAAWIAPSAQHRPEFDASGFVRSSDTLYLHSQEGRGSEAGLVTAMTMAVCEHGVELAKDAPGGRLNPPMVGILDEACNICRMAALPAQFSHYGSRGIPLNIIAQSWSQMREVWGENGVEQLWSAANVKLFGGGVDEEPFLRRLESLLGEYNRATYSPSVSHGGGQRGQRSTSWQLTPTSILTVADLRGLPREQNFPTARRPHPKPTCRGVLFASGMPAVLVRPEYWWLTRWEQEIKESQRRYDRGSGQPAPAVSANPWVAASRGA